MSDRPSAISKERCPLILDAASSDKVLVWGQR